MNAEARQSSSQARLAGWICIAVLAGLCIEYSLRLVNQWEQRGQMKEARVSQTAAMTNLSQASGLDTRLEALSLDLLQLAKTNTTARQIVQEFNIQWHPPATPPSPTNAAAPVKK